MAIAHAHPVGYPQGRLRPRARRRARAGDRARSLLRRHAHPAPRVGLRPRARCWPAPAARGTAPSSGAARTSARPGRSRAQGLTYGDGEADPGRHARLERHGPRRHGLRRRRAGWALPLRGRGVTWSHVAGLREHPSTPGWQPGAGGLILHSIVPHPTDPARMWVGISAVGVFHTADGGATWEARNTGVRAVGEPDEYPETGQCVHKFGLHPARPEVLYQQNHSGAYRSDDGGLDVAGHQRRAALALRLPIAVHPHDPRTIWTVPLNGDDRGRFMPDGRAAVWMSRDEGATWAPADRGPAPGGRLRGRPARGHGDRSARPGRRLRRDQHRAALRESRRGPQLATPGRLPARHLVGRDRRSSTTEPGHGPRPPAALARRPCSRAPRAASRSPAHDLAEPHRGARRPLPGHVGPPLRARPTPPPAHQRLRGRPAGDARGDASRADSVVHIIPAVSGGAVERRARSTPRPSSSGTPGSRSTTAARRGSGSCRGSRARAGRPSPTRRPSRRRSATAGSTARTGASTTSAACSGIRRAARAASGRARTRSASRGSRPRAA